MKSRSSCEFDGISMNLLKKVWNIFYLNLRHQTLIAGNFTDKIKITKVNSIYKKFDNTPFTNYSLISLLPVISKCFEKVIYKQLYAFFQHFILNALLISYLIISLNGQMTHLHHMAIILFYS